MVAPQDHRTNSGLTDSVEWGWILQNFVGPPGFEPGTNGL